MTGPREDVERARDLILTMSEPVHRDDVAGPREPIGAFARGTDEVRYGAQVAYPLEDDIARGHAERELRRRLTRLAVSLGLGEVEVPVEDAPPQPVDPEDPDALRVGYLRASFVLIVPKPVVGFYWTDPSLPPAYPNDQRTWCGDRHALDDDEGTVYACTRFAGHPGDHVAGGRSDPDSEDPRRLMVHAVWGQQIEFTITRGPA